MTITLYDELEAHGGAVVPRDRWGRPMIEGKAWTRATTFAGSIADKEGLIPWACEMTARGLATRADLLASAASVLDDPKALRKVAADAKEAGGASSAATLGTALHRMTESADRGEPTPDLHADRVAEYRACLEANGVEILPEWIERMVLNETHTVAGTPDRLVMWRGQLTVLDLKTGKDLRYAMSEIAIQLALYANADAGWDHATEARVPFPSPVRRDLALVVHLPAAGEGCRMLEVDIAAGWEAATLASQVRAWRKRKNLAADSTPAEAPTPPHPRIIGSVPPLTKRDAPTWTPPDEGPLLDLDDLKAQITAGVAAIAAKWDTTPEEVTARIGAWKDESRRASRSFALTDGTPSTRRRNIYRAAARLAAATTDDDDARQVVARNCPELGEVQPAMTVGMLLGTLSSSQAAAICGDLDAVVVGTKTRGAA